MPFDQDLETLKNRLQTLAATFSAAVRSRGSATALPVSQRDAAGRLRIFAEKQAHLICAEADELCHMADLSHERASLVLRYRAQIFGGESQVAASLVTEDMTASAQSTSIAANYFMSAESYNQNADLSGLKARLVQTAGESQRLIQGIVASTEKPMMPEEVTAFYAGYATPDDPCVAFNTVTESLTRSSLALAHRAADRVENTLGYVDCIDRVVIPAFPEHSEGFRHQADNMLQEMAGSLKRAAALVEQAITYKHEVR